MQGQVALTSANLLKSLADLAQPGLTQAGLSAISDLGQPGTEPNSVRTAFATARLRAEQDFDAAQARARAEIAQEAKQAGGNFGTAAIGEATALADRTIDEARSGTLRGQAFEEANAGLTQTNFLLSNLFRTGGTAAQGALGFGQNAVGAGQILSSLASQREQQYSTYGSIAGTVLGGVAGYFAGNPVLGASLGSAAGGAVGGWLGSG